MWVGEKKDCYLKTVTRLSEQISHTWSRNKDLMHCSASKIPGTYVMFHRLDLLDLLNGERHCNTLFLSILHVCGEILEEGGTRLVRLQQDYLNFIVPANSMQQLSIPCY